MRIRHVFRLGLKEWWSLLRDPALLLLIVYTFSLSVYGTATSMPQTLNRAPIAIVDEDASPLSIRIAAAFFPPQFTRPTMIGADRVDAGLDAGIYTFVLQLPSGLQRDVLAGRGPDIQLLVDATRMNQAFTGTGYVQNIVDGEIADFVARHRAAAAPPVELAIRPRFNPALDQTWFGGTMQLVDSITMLSIILTGAALIREREHGTLEHLMVMPVTPTEIMLAKVWSMATVVLLAATASLQFVVRGLLAVPLDGSMALFLAGSALFLFATTSMGIFLATVARTMPQFGLLMILTMMPLQMLSGAMTPRESMPAAIRDLMLLAPTTHFVELAQAILFRGAGLAVVWPSFAALAGIGAVLFLVALRRFRRTIG